MDTDTLGYVVAAIVAIGIWALRHTRKERTNLAEWAEQHGWTYAPEATDLPGSWNSFPFSRSSSLPGTAAHTLATTLDGATVRSFRYEQPHTSQNSDAPRWHILCLELERPVPTIECLPEQLSRTIEKSLPGGGRIRLHTDDQAFERIWAAFAIGSDAEAEAARELLDHRVTDRLIEADPQRSPWWFILDDHHVMAAWPGAQKPERIEPTLPILRDLARLIDEPR